MFYNTENLLPQVQDPPGAKLFKDPFSFNKPGYSVTSSLCGKKIRLRAAPDQAYDGIRKKR